MTISQLGKRPKLTLAAKPAPVPSIIPADQAAAIARRAESYAAPLELFFLVWAPSVGKARRRHPTLEAAQAEASRLRELNPDIEYLVYECKQVQS